MIRKHLQQSHADMLQIIQNTSGLDSDPKLETESSKINQLCLETRELVLSSILVPFLRYPA